MLIMVKKAKLTSVFQ